MARNKPRLQLVLYARPKHPASYHYALFIAPKVGCGPATRHHVKNTLQIDSAGVATAPWRYEQFVVTDFKLEQRILVRIVVAKVLKSITEVQALLERLPVPRENSFETSDCVTWVRDAFEELRKQNAVSIELESWDHANAKALEFLEKKRQQKRWDSTWSVSCEIPLMDLLEGKELVQ